MENSVKGYTVLAKHVHKLEVSDVFTPPLAPEPEIDSDQVQEPRQGTMRELLDLGKKQKHGNLAGLPQKKEVPILVNTKEEAGCNVYRTGLFSPVILEQSGVVLLPGSPPVAQLYQGTRRNRCMLLREFATLNTIWSIGFHLNLYFFFSAAIWLIWTEREPRTLLLFPVVISAISYLIILIECHNSSALAIINKMIDTNEACDYIERLRRTKPYVTLEILPFRFRVRYSSIAEEEVIKQYLEKQNLEETELYVSRKEIKFVNFSSLVDASGGLGIHLGGGITKVFLDINFGFLGRETFDVYNDAKKKLVTVRGQDDMFAQSTEAMLLPGLHQSIIVYNPLKITLNLFISRPAFWVFSVLCLTWPYRIWLASRTKFVKFTIVKLIAHETHNAIMEETTL